MNNLGTAAATNVFAAIALASSPTAMVFGQPAALQPRLILEFAIAQLGSRTSRKSQVGSPSAITLAADAVSLSHLSRQTTAAEHVVGELRSWSLLSANWDGEGALAPIEVSLKEAVSFVRLMSDRDDVEPMLHASSGRAGLYFKNNNLYADIEFYGDTRVAYYIERNGGRHKGVVHFDSKTMPTVFDALLKG